MAAVAARRDAGGGAGSKGGIFGGSGLGLGLPVSGGKGKKGRTLAQLQQLPLPQKVLLLAVLVQCGGLLVSGIIYAALARPPEGMLSGGPPLCSARPTAPQLHAMGAFLCLLLSGLALRCLASILHALLAESGTEIYLIAAANFLVAVVDLATWAGPSSDTELLWREANASASTYSPCSHSLTYPPYLHIRANKFTARVRAQMHLCAYTSPCKHRAPRGAPGGAQRAL